jgi:hypothetical protein
VVFGDLIGRWFFRNYFDREFMNSLSKLKRLESTKREQPVKIEKN